MYHCSHAHACTPAVGTLPALLTFSFPLFDRWVKGRCSSSQRPADETKTRDLFNDTDMSDAKARRNHFYSLCAFAVVGVVCRQLHFLVGGALSQGNRGLSTQDDATRLLQGILHFNENNMTLAQKPSMVIHVGPSKVWLYTIMQKLPTHNS